MMCLHYLSLVSLVLNLTGSLHGLGERTGLVQGLCIVQLVLIHIGMELDQLLVAALGEGRGADVRWLQARSRGRH